MTIGEAIARVDQLKPNQYDRAQKVEWLSQADGEIWNNIIATHEVASWDPWYNKPGAEESEDEDKRPPVFRGYGPQTDDNQPLLMNVPYDQGYIHWLESRIDYANGEYGKYNNTNTTWNSDLGMFRNYWQARHMPLGAKCRYW